MSSSTFAFITTTIVIASANVILPQTTHQISFNLTEKFCVQYRRDLELHSAATKSERRDADKLSVAGLALSWIPFVPGLPLGISAIVFGLRRNTAERRRLFRAGVRPSNWDKLNVECAQTLSLDPLEGVSFEGPQQKAVNFGIAAVFISLVSGLILVFYITMPYNFECGCVDGKCFRIVYD